MRPRQTAQGTLRCFRAIKKQKLNVKNDWMEELLQKQEKGLLVDHIRKAMAGCKAQ